MPHTRRRLVLSGAATAIVAIAGCLDDGSNDDESDNNSPDDGGQSNDTDGNESAENGAENGEENGAENGEENGAENGEENGAENGEGQTVDQQLDDIEQGLLEAFEEGERVANEANADPATDEFDLSTFDAALSGVEMQLDAVREDVGPEQQQRFEALEQFAALASAFRDDLAALNDIVAPFETADGFIEADQWEQALDPLRQSRDAVGPAQDSLVDTQETLNAIAAADLPGVTQSDIDDIAESLSELDTIYTALDSLLDGLISIAEGIGPFEEGTEAFDAEEYGAAIAPMETAEAKFSEATTTFETGASEVEDSEFGSDLDELACQWSSLTDAAGHFVDAARAFDAGNDEAGREAEDDAQAAIRASENCASGEDPLSLAPDATVTVPSVALPDRVVV